MSTDDAQGRLSRVAHNHAAQVAAGLTAAGIAAAGTTLRILHARHNSGGVAQLEFDLVGATLQALEELGTLRMFEELCRFQLGVSWPVEMVEVCLTPNPLAESHQGAEPMPRHYQLRLALKRSLNPGEFEAIAEALARHASHYLSATIELVPLTTDPPGVSPTH